MSTSRPNTMSDTTSREAIRLMRNVFDWRAQKAENKPMPSAIPR